MLLYFDCFSGISGDMTLGALIDLGVPVPWLREKLTSLPLSGFDLTAADVAYNGIRAKRVEVADDGRVQRNYAVIRDLIAQSPLAANVRERALGIFGRLAAAEAGVHGCPLEEVHFHEIGGVDSIVDIVGPRFAWTISASRRSPPHRCRPGPASSTAATAGCRFRPRLPPPCSKECRSAGPMRPGS